MLKTYILRFFFLFFLSFSSLRAEETYEFNFSEITDLRDVVSIYANIFQKNFIFDSAINKKVQIIAPHKLTKDEIQQLFLSTLNMAGLTVVETVQALKIVPINTGLKSQLPTYDLENLSLYSDRVVTQVIPLRHAKAEDVKNTLLKFSTADRILTYPQTNSLIISDTGFKVRSILEIIRELDKKSPQSMIEIVPIKNRGAQDVVNVLKELQKSEKVAVTQTDKLFVDAEANSIIILGNRIKIDAIKVQIQRLDVSMEGSLGEQVFVHRLQFTDAQTIARIIGSSFVTNQKKQIKIIADTESNSLLISSNAQDYDEVRRILEKIDIKKPQVLMQVDIIEIQDDHGFRFATAGMKNFDYNKANIITGWEGGTVAPMVTLATGQTPSDAKIAQAASVFSQDFSFGVLNTKGLKVSGIGDLSAVQLLKLIKTDANSKILASPFILAVNNEESVFSTGDVIYFKSGDYDAMGSFQGKLEKEEASIGLTLKPIITGNQDISIDLNLDASTVIGLTPSGAPQVAKRKIKQKIQLRNDQTAFVAGYLRKSDLLAKKKIPILGDLPLLGVFFRSTQKTMTDARLLVLISPYIIFGEKDLENLYKNQMKLGQKEEKHQKDAF